MARSDRLSPDLQRAVRRWKYGAHRLTGRTIGTLTHVVVDESVAALTFDDGPDPRHTPRLLEILERYGARATFFVIGSRAAEHPELLAEMALAGHEIGNHTWDHPSLSGIGRRACARQLQRCAEAIQPSRPRLMRPPYTEQDLTSYLTSRRMGYEVVAWNVQIEDWRPHPPEVLEEWLVGRMRPGCIAVLHDSLWRPTHPEARDRGPLLEALDRALGRLRSFRFVTVSELMAVGRPVRVPWFADRSGVGLTKAWRPRREPVT